MDTTSTAIQVVFCAEPRIGERVPMLVNGQPATSSVIANVQTHPQYPGWFWIDTQSGSRYGGQMQDSNDSRTQYGISIPSSQPIHTTAGTKQAIWTPQTLGIAGATVLFLAVFAPILRVPILGSTNFLMGGIGSGMIVMIIAIAALAFAALERYWPLLVSGILATIVIGLSFWLMVWAKWTTLSEATKDNNIAGGLIANAAIQIEWGWALLIIGSCVITFSAFWAIKKQRFSFRAKY